MPDDTYQYSLVNNKDQLDAGDPMVVKRRKAFRYTW